MAERTRLRLPLLLPYLPDCLSVLTARTMLSFDNGLPTTIHPHLLPHLPSAVLLELEMAADPPKI